MTKRLAVFCGSSTGKNISYSQAASTVGKLMSEQGIGVVYGGGKIGLMGVVADAALAHGGEVIGVIPEKLMTREVGHMGLTELRVVATMHERKAIMAELSDGFIALPGGIGTIEEIMRYSPGTRSGITTSAVASSIPMATMISCSALLITWWKKDSCPLNNAMNSSFRKTQRS